MLLSFLFIDFDNEHFLMIHYIGIFDNEYHITYLKNIS
jgi:hypothetical protein